MRLQIKQLTETAIVPTFAHATDAGMDLCADEAITLAAGERGVIKTGIAMAIPVGHVGLIWDKSGISTKRGIKTLAGVVDAGYRGEVMVGLLNTDSQEQRFEPGDKIAQILIQKIDHPEVEVVTELDETERGEGGFGSTGK